MAGRRKAATDVAEAPKSGLTLAVRESVGVPRAERTREENPVLDAVQASVSEGPKAYDVDSADDAKAVENYLRRAAKTLNVGLKQHTTDNGNGTFTVDFEATAEKRQRAYNAEQIRAWYGETFQTNEGPATLSGPIPTEVRDAFKVANGYAKGTVELHGATFGTSE